eukprot:2374427-Rhodomonas_salina.1
MPAGYLSPAVGFASLGPILSTTALSNFNAMSAAPTLVWRLATLVVPGIGNTSSPWQCSCKRGARRGGAQMSGPGRTAHARCEGLTGQAACMCAVSREGKRSARLCALCGAELAYGAPPCALLASHVVCVEQYRAGCAVAPCAACVVHAMRHGEARNTTAKPHANNALRFWFLLLAFSARFGGNGACDRRRQNF